MSSADHSRAEQIHAAAFEAAPDALIAFATDGTIVAFNSAAERLFKISRADVINRPGVEAIVPDSLRAEIAALELKLQGSNDIRLFRSYGLRGDGTTFPTEMRMSLSPWPVPGIADGMDVFVGFIRDRSTDSVSESVVRVPEHPTASREAVGEVLENLSVVLSAAPVIVFTTDRDGIIQVSTGALLDAVGFYPGQLVGQNIFTLFADRADVTRDYRRALDGEQFRVRVQIGDHWFDTQYKPMYSEDGDLRGTVGVSVDVTAQISSELALRRLYETDPVTGLASRTHTKALLEQVLFAGGPMTLLLVDLDQFKDINDSHGHAIGDHVLNQVGDRIRRTLPPGSVLGRLGGDELLIGLRTDDHTQIAQNAAAILTAISGPMWIEIDDTDSHSDLDVSVTASIGIAVAPGDGDTIATLLTRADSAMYAAKQSGRGAYAFYRADADKSSRRLKVSTRLRRAVAAGDLTVAYQPIYDLLSNTVTGFESLARWTDPILGRVDPEEFIALAEASPLIEDLFDAVLHQALEAAVAWNSQGSDAGPSAGKPRCHGGEIIRVGVNVAARQLRDPRLPQRIVDAARQAGFPLNCIMIELTESAVMDAGKTVRKVLRDIRAAGMQVAIDDYGIGYSNMARLGELSAERIVDAVKVDRSFIADLPAEPAKVLISTIVTMANSLGLTVVAEGIETQEQFDIVRDLGCRFGQGWYLSKAISAQDAIALVGETATSFDSA